MLYVFLPGMYRDSNKNASSIFLYSNSTHHMYYSEAILCELRILRVNRYSLQFIRHFSIFHASLCPATLCPPLSARTLSVSRSLPVHSPSLALCESGRLCPFLSLSPCLSFSPPPIREQNSLKLSLNLIYSQTHFSSATKRFASYHIWFIAILCRDVRFTILAYI